jgi:cell wall-associated NlpC family hydrolase
LTNFFADEKRVQLLRDEVNGWVGTPYRHWSGVKGMGCDCIHFVARVFEAMGLGPYKIPWYPKDWHLHRSQELLETGIVTQNKMTEVSPNEVMDGDVLLYQYGRTISHSAIYVDGYVYGALTGAKVEKIRFTDKTSRKRLVKVLRLME